MLHKHVLDSTGYSYIWLNQTHTASNSIHTMIKERLVDQFNQDWHSRLNNSSKGKMYSYFKDDIAFESYLTSLPQALRISMVHYRTGNHRLPVEVGRWKQAHVAHENRTCNLCTSNDIGDEMHYLLFCSHFTSTRLRFIPLKYFTKPSISKFKYLMCNSNVQLLTMWHYS